MSILLKEAAAFNGDNVRSRWANAPDPTVALPEKVQRLIIKTFNYATALVPPSRHKIRKIHSVRDCERLGGETERRGEGGRWTSCFTCVKLRKCTRQKELSCRFSSCQLLQSYLPICKLTDGGKIKCNINFFAKEENNLSRRQKLSNEENQLINSARFLHA